VKGAIMPTTEETIKDIVVKIVHCDREVLTPDATFQDMKADSLDMVQVLVALEDEFGIEIPDEDAQNFKNFGDFVSYVEGRLADKS